MYLKLGHFLIKFGKNFMKNADVSKNSADFSEKVYVFRNYISRATSMPNFTSIGHSYQRLTRGASNVHKIAHAE